MKYIHSELDKTNRLRQIAYLDRFSMLFKEKLAASQTLRQAFFDLLQGETTYSEIEKRATRQVLGKVAGTLTGWPSKLTGKLRG